MPKRTKKRTTMMRRGRRRDIVPKRCFFCGKKVEPSALEPKVLAPFLTHRGKIRGSKRSGLCSKHQRRLATQIKRARNLGLLPFKIEG